MHHFILKCEQQELVSNKKILSPIYGNSIEMNVDKQRACEINITNNDTDTMQKIRTFIPECKCDSNEILGTTIDGDTNDYISNDNKTNCIGII